MIDALLGPRVRLKPVDVGDYGFIRHIETIGDRLASYRHRGFVQSPEEFARRLWAGVFGQFVVVTRDSGSALGIVSGFSLDQRSQHAELAVIAAPGLGDDVAMFFEGVALFVDYVFREMNVRKLYAYVIERNRLAIPGRWREMITVEGVLSEHVYLDGGFEDVHILAIRHDGWRAAHGRANAAASGGCEEAGEWLTYRDFVGRVVLDLGVDVDRDGTEHLLLVDDLGLDSLGLTTLMMLVDELRGAPLDEAMIAGMRTLGDAYRFASIPLTT